MILPYTYEVCSTGAHHPRKAGSTILPTDRLVVAYARYLPREELKNDGKVILNLMFTHGTGMNKSVWRHHIDRLYQLSCSPSVNLPWKLGKVLAMDAVNHCDSAVLNKRKLGHKFFWGDFGKDALAIMKHEGLRNSESQRTIGVGHSLGGHAILCAGAFEPIMFDSIFAVDPVIYDSHSFERDNVEVWDLHNKIHRRIEKNLLDQFANEEECFRWFQKEAFYNKFQPEVLDYFMRDEVIYNSDGTVSCKTTAKQQVVVYTSRDISVLQGRTLLQFITFPVLHLVGSRFTSHFTPEAVEYIRSTLPDVTGAMIENAGHLLHCERFDETMEIMEDWFTKRTMLEFRGTLDVSNSDLAGREEIFCQRYAELFASMDQNNPLFKGPKL
ncbi:hypothetical protein BABINDRAFT_6910 [Babjeviella inositovora NRRL Y-12698]|uniref:AB hydrolase-1 domain-containing protein n=1 Tax=Babjeviella inositovora NRRL Y-12698 TaxID=984486 RepID=A0A1E3QTR3_9ASCO|nr:uncharacterized protein BABINDRAFT_6910 [Babjeviella inositovora NRRL Y-12698]ODQ81068.1 hypothetical protein BABINDRAFT_6910 [Babjeviella inositovora NRRL Y-12698]